MRPAYILSRLPGGAGAGGSGLGATTADNYVTLAPIYPLIHTNYNIGVYTTADEGFYLGYNLGRRASNTEPESITAHEINWSTVARGVSAQRTMEQWNGYTGAYVDGGAVATTATQKRTIFYSFESLDTSNGGYGEILYGYLSTGFNPSYTYGGGALTIASDGTATTSNPFATIGVDGSYIYNHRTVGPIQNISAATAGANSAFTVSAGSQFVVNANVQIFKPVAIGSLGAPWLSEWNSVSITSVTTGTTTRFVLGAANTTRTGLAGASVTLGTLTGTGTGWAKISGRRYTIIASDATLGASSYITLQIDSTSGFTSFTSGTLLTVVTGAVTSISGNVVTTNINSTTYGIVGGAVGTGYGVQIAFPSASTQTPSLQSLSVGTAAINANVPYTLEVAGSVGVVGSVKVAEPLLAPMDPGLFPTKGLFRVATSRPDTTGLHQLFAFTNTQIDFSIGYPRDNANARTDGSNYGTGGYDGYMLSIGRGASTDTSFTTANSIATFFTADDATHDSVGIGGINPFNIARVSIAASNASMAHINLYAGAAKTTPISGDIYYDGTDIFTYQGSTLSTIPAGPALTGGTSQATFIATNKPGTNNRTTPAAWVKWISGGTTYYIPAFTA